MPSRYELARIRRARLQDAFAPLPNTKSTRTCFDDVFPWQERGFVMQPPPPAPNYDAMPPLEPEEFIRILRRLCYDPSNRRNGSVHQRKIPIATLAQACGYSRRTLRIEMYHATPPKLMIKKMSPILRKIEAGLIEAVRGPMGVELRNVVDAKVPQKDVR